MFFSLSLVNMNIC